VEGSDAQGDRLRRHERGWRADRLSGHGFVGALGEPAHAQQRSAPQAGMGGLRHLSRKEGAADFRSGPTYSSVRLLVTSAGIDFRGQVGRFRRP